MTVGVPAALTKLVRRIVAPNPGIMTGPGTNTYLVGIDEIVVIDPGPDEPAHLDAIAGCGGDRIRWIVVTHTHPDHSPGAASLRARLSPDVLVMGFGPGGDFDPDAEIGEAHVIDSTEFRLRSLHTPGHASNHLCYFLEEERVLFSGDHIMNGSTVVIAPPDGDMTAYLASLERLRSLRIKAIAPGHGDVIDDPRAKVDEYIAHRLERERMVVAALSEKQASTVDGLLPDVYPEISDQLRPWARMSLWAHLRKLAVDGRASSNDVDDIESRWEAVA